MARVVADDEGGPAAFGVRLSGINKNGRPSEPKRIHVNAQTAVQMIFLDASYVLRETLGCDMEQLQNDFDLYLLRPGTHDIALNPSRAIADYGVGKNDELQFRRKEKPINICVNLYAGENRKVTVNSGYPLSDVVTSICKDVGIENHTELSLAIHDGSPKCMQLQWLDNASSLDGQGVNKGDTLLLRKKFFILNDDITEAIEGNSELKELIYQQIFECYLSENYVGGGVNDNYNCSLISALLHQIEQSGENISDDAAVSKMMPKNRQENMGFYTQIVTTYYQTRVGTLDKIEAKKKLLYTLSQPQSIIVNYYPVKKASGDSEELVLAIDSDKAFLCQEQEGGKLKLVDQKAWKLRDILDTDCTSLKDNFLKVNVLGSWHEFVTSHRVGLSNYLLEARALVKQRVARGRMSTYFPSPPESTEPPILIEPEQTKLELEPETELEPEPEPEPEPDLVTEPEVQPEQEPEPAPGSPVEPLEPAVLAERSASYQWPLNTAASDKNTNLDEIKLNDDNIGEDQPKLDLGSGAETDLNILPPGRTSIREKSPTKSMTLTISYIHIPGFLGMDYREVLEKFHHFHVVVLDQDVRPILLEIQKPVHETIDTICSTFCVPNSSEFYLSIPNTEKRRIIAQKSTLSGTFKRKQRQQKASEFNPILADDKTLEEQYNFSVKPYLLYLKRKSSDDIDGPQDEMIDGGREWPPNENRDVARYRNFYQSWTGIVQGAYPVERKAAIRLAALLTQVYYGDKDNNKVWPPLDYDCKAFLPDGYCEVLGIATEVDKEHGQLAGKSTQECISDVIEGCNRLLTYRGVFFDVSVPKKSEIMGVIPWNKMERYIFGVNQHGIFKINRQTGKTIFTRRFSDIYQWKRTDARFQLNFKEWAEEFDAYSNQSNEILDTLDLFIQTTKKKIQQLQASSRPTSFSAESLGRSGSHRSSTPRKSPINDMESQSPKRSSTSSPTTYDL